MMGRLKSDQGQLFYEFHLGDAVPEDHLVRKIGIDFSSHEIPSMQFMFAIDRRSGTGSGAAVDRFCRSIYGGLSVWQLLLGFG
jgi:hypothetical protein